MPQPAAPASGACPAAAPAPAPTFGGFGAPVLVGAPADFGRFGVEPSQAPYLNPIALFYASAAPAPTGFGSGPPAPAPAFSFGAAPAPAPAPFSGFGAPSLDAPRPAAPAAAPAWGGPAVAAPAQGAPTAAPDPAWGAAAHAAATALGTGAPAWSATLSNEIYSTLGLPSYVTLMLACAMKTVEELRLKDWFRASGASDDHMTYVAITAMPAYASKSFEELRLEDWFKARGAPQPAVPAAVAPAKPTQAFGFGQPAPAAKANPVVLAPAPAPAPTGFGFGAPALAPAFNFGAALVSGLGAALDLMGVFGAPQWAAAARRRAPVLGKRTPSWSASLTYESDRMLFRAAYEARR